MAGRWVNPRFFALVPAGLKYTLLNSTQRTASEMPAKKLMRKDKTFIRNVPIHFTCINNKASPISKVKLQCRFENDHVEKATGVSKKSVSFVDGEKKSSAARPSKRPRTSSPFFGSSSAAAANLGSKTVAGSRADQIENQPSLPASPFFHTASPAPSPISNDMTANGQRVPRRSTSSLVAGQDSIGFSGACGPSGESPAAAASGSSSHYDNIFKRAKLRYSTSGWPSFHHQPPTPSGRFEGLVELPLSESLPVRRGMGYQPPAASSPFQGVSYDDDPVYHELDLIGHMSHNSVVAAVAEVATRGFVTASGSYPAEEPCLTSSLAVYQRQMSASVTFSSLASPSGSLPRRHPLTPATALTSTAVQGSGTVVVPGAYGSFSEDRHCSPTCILTDRAGLRSRSFLTSSFAAGGAAGGSGSSTLSSFSRSYSVSSTAAGGVIGGVSEGAVATGPASSSVSNTTNSASDSADTLSTPSSMKAAMRAAVAGFATLYKPGQLDEHNGTAVPSCHVCKPGASNAGWCRHGVYIPSVNWQKVFESSLDSHPEVKLAPRGYSEFRLAEGIRVLLVEDALHVRDALDQLRQDMKDPYLSVDLEWRPEMRAGAFNPVALVQLAAGSTVLLLRTSAMGFRWPPELDEFMRRPDVVFVGFSWGNGDEQRLERSFGFSGRRSFAAPLVDLQSVAKEMGFERGIGLARLTRAVLSGSFQKSRSVSVSNWAAPRLSPLQLKYGALDALAAGQVFRALRLWHHHYAAASEKAAQVEAQVEALEQGNGEGDVYANAEAEALIRATQKQQVKSPKSPKMSESGGGGGASAPAHASPRPGDGEAAICNKSTPAAMRNGGGVTKRAAPAKVAKVAKPAAAQMWRNVLNSVGKMKTVGVGSPTMAPGNGGDGGSQPTRPKS